MQRGTPTSPLAPLWASRPRPAPGHLPPAPHQANERFSAHLHSFRSPYNSSFWPGSHQNALFFNFFLHKQNYAVGPRAGQRGAGVPSPSQARSHKSDPLLSGGGSGSLLLSPRHTNPRFPNGTQGSKAGVLRTWGTWVARARGHRPRPHRETAGLGPPGRPAWPRVAPPQTATGSQPRTRWEGHGRPGRCWGHSVGTKPFCKHWRPQPCSGSHEGKKQKMEQTRRESVYFVKACADQRGAPGPPKGAAGLLPSAQRATGLALAKETVPAAQAFAKSGGRRDRPRHTSLTLPGLPGTYLPAARRDQRGFKTTNKQTKNEMLLSPSAYLGSEKKNIFVLFHC
nr:uncharacterized protein LOC129045430 [Mirounga angustirostris]